MANFESEEIKELIGDGESMLSSDTYKRRGEAVKSDFWIRAPLTRLAEQT